MVYLISLLGIIIEISLPFNSNILMVTLSFLLYIINTKKEKATVYIGIIAMILSLQTNDIFRMLVILYIAYYLINTVFLHLVYEKSNILVFLIIQGLLYWIISKNNFDFKYLVINIVGFTILNFVYIHISKKRTPKQVKG